MIYKLLADLVVTLHFAWILFLFLGAIWGTRYRRVKMIHLSGLGFAFFIQILDWYCPLSRRIYQPVDDEKYIVVDLDFDLVEETIRFKEFLETAVRASAEASPGLAGRPQAPGVLRPFPAGMPFGQAAIA